MALYDVDKGSQDRGAPSPNRPDVVDEGAVRAHKTVSTSYTTDAVTSTARVQFSNNKITVYDGSNERIVLGALPDGTLGLAISKVGEDVSGAYS